MSKLVTLSFDVPVERTGLYIDLLLEEGIEARVSYPNQLLGIVKNLGRKHNGITRHVEKGKSTMGILHKILLEDKGTTLHILEKHLTSQGYKGTTTTPTLSRLKQGGFAVRKDDLLWYKTKKVFKEEDSKLKK